MNPACQKRLLIEQTLSEGLFGHIVIGNTFWSHLGQYIDEYQALCVKHEGESSEKLASKLADILLAHPQFEWEPKNRPT